MHGEEKMSKSLGNVIHPTDEIKEFGLDAFRYFMLREVPFGQDGTYTRDAMTLRYNTDLANDIGNLLHRTLSMMEKYYKGIIPGKGAANADNILRKSCEELPQIMERTMDRQQYHETLSAALPSFE